MRCTDTFSAAECAFERADLPRAFNFGPNEHEARTVSWLAAAMAARWGEGASSQVAEGPHPYEAATLALDSSLARQVLQMEAAARHPTAVAWTTDWYRSERDLTNSQIEDFMERATDMTVCRFCSNPLTEVVADLGVLPLSNALVTPGGLDAPGNVLSAGHLDL